LLSTGQSHNLSDTGALQRSNLIVKTQSYKRTPTKLVREESMSELDRLLKTTTGKLRPPINEFTVKEP
jgi:hypothetical protein